MFYERYDLKTGTLQVRMEESGADFDVVERCYDNEYVGSNPYEWRDPSGRVVSDEALVAELESAFDDNQ